MGEGLHSMLLMKALRKIQAWILLVGGLTCQPGIAADYERQCVWRGILERIYYEQDATHKTSFDQTFNPQFIRQLVLKDLRKQKLLLTVFGVRITRDMIDNEVQRMERNSRNTALLARLKEALGPGRDGFDEVVVKPALADRLLRNGFLEDDSIHRKQRDEARMAREKLLVGNPVEGMISMKWMRRHRPHGEGRPASHISSSEVVSTSSSYMNTASLNFLPRGGIDDGSPVEIHMDDVDPDEFDVLQQNLVKKGDVSPIIETMNDFAIYKAVEIHEDFWKLQCLRIPRMDFTTWLEGQLASVVLE